MPHDTPQPDIVIFGVGIAGLWTLHALKKRGYNVILFEKDTIANGQTLAAQGIIHSGLKFTLAGKVNALAQSIRQMPLRWRDALAGKGDVDLSAAQVNAESQHLLIPKGFIGGITNILTQKMLGAGVSKVDRKEWSEELAQSGFNGSMIFMNELVVDVPSVVNALCDPYRDVIYKISAEDAAQPFDFLKSHNIQPKRILFTAAADNHEIATRNNNDSGLQTQKRPLVQAMIKNAPFDLYAHLVGKSEKPVASITTHYTEDKQRVWYVGGGVAECATDTDPQQVFRATYEAIKKYLPHADTDKLLWAALPINRVEGKSKTDNWMPDTPTLHNTDGALYCWPTKLTFAPMLADMVLADLEQRGITPSNTQSSYNFEQAAYAKAPWDLAKWSKIDE